MSNDKHDHYTHNKLLRETGIHKITKEQQDAMNQIMGDTIIELREDAIPEPTMDLPILSRRPGAK